jgi:hypothetical protein
MLDECPTREVFVLGDLYHSYKRHRIVAISLDYEHSSTRDATKLSYCSRRVIQVMKNILDYDCIEARRREWEVVSGSLDEFNSCVKSPLGVSLKVEPNDGHMAIEQHMCHRTISAPDLQERLALAFLGYELDEMFKVFDDSDTRWPTGLCINMTPAWIDRLILGCRLFVGHVRACRLSLS